MKLEMRFKLEKKIDYNIGLRDSAIFSLRIQLVN